MTWRALLAMLRKPWADAEYIAAYMADLLAWLRWAKTEDAQHGRGMPDPLPRPGDDLRPSLADEVRESIQQAQAIWGGD